MPNRKEPRLEFEEQQPDANPASDAYDQPEVFPADSTSTSPVEQQPVHCSRNGASGKAWLGIFLALIALGALAWQFLQLQEATQQLARQQASMQLLGNRVQELEGVLSATGDDLSAAGKKLNEKLDWADSEIRKLWVIAHQRNRPAIEALESKAKQLEQGLSKAEKQLAEALEVSKSVVVASKAATEQNLGLTKDLNKYNVALKTNTDELNTQIKALAQRLTEVSLTTSTLDERLRNQDLRTSLASLEKRVTELTNKAPSTQTQPDEVQVKSLDKSLEKLTAQLAEQQEILTSLEASRGQLVGRVTRLMDDVRQLQQRR